MDEPSRPKERTDSDEPTDATSIIEREKTEPKWLIPNTESVDVKRLKLRKESEEPTCATFKQDNVEPIRPKLRNDKVDPS